MVTIKDKKYLTLKESSDKLGIGKWKFIEMHKKGTLKFFKIGSTILIEETDLDNLIKEV